MYLSCSGKITLERFFEPDTFNLMKNPKICFTLNGGKVYWFLLDLLLDKDWADDRASPLLPVSRGRRRTPGYDIIVLNVPVVLKIEQLYH